jgi:hypothetical protein
MKSNARKAHKPHATEEAGNHTAKPFVVGAKRRRRKRAEPEKIRKSELHRIALTNMDPVKSALLADLREKFSRPLDEHLDHAAVEEALVPAVVIDHLRMAELLFRVAVAAKTAQRITDVPASTLIALARLSWTWERFSEAGYDAQTGETNDYFAIGESFESVEASFLDQALRLASSRKFRPVMHAAEKESEYVRALEGCRLWSYDVGIADIVRNYGLHQCDRK